MQDIHYLYHNLIHTSLLSFSEDKKAGHNHWYNVEGPKTHVDHCLHVFIDTLPHFSLLRF